MASHASLIRSQRPMSHESFRKMQMIFTANSRKPYVCFQKEAFQWDFEALILSGIMIKDFYTSGNLSDSSRLRLFHNYGRSIVAFRERA